MEEKIEKNQSLHDQLFKLIRNDFPPTIQKMYVWVTTPKYQADINQARRILLKMKLKCPQQIEKICIKSGILNDQLYIVATLFRQEKYLRYFLISMFGIMITSKKMMKYLTKLNVPLYIYLFLIKQLSSFQKNQQFQKFKIQQSIKFIHEWAKKQKENFPRLFANIINMLLEFFCIQPIKDRINFVKDAKSTDLQYYTFQTALQILNRFPRISAETGIMGTMFKKSVEGEFDIFRAAKTLQAIINLYNWKQNRHIIEEIIDFGKIFAAIMDNQIYKSKLDNSIKLQDANTRVKISQSARLVQLSLSMWPSLAYLLQQKNILRNFLKSLKTKSQKDLEIILDRTFGSILRRILTYENNEVNKFQNAFIANSASLIFRNLLLIYNLIEKYDFLHILEKIDKKEIIKFELNQVIVQYFPEFFQIEKSKNHKIAKFKIINFKQDPEKVLQIKSFWNQCVLDYEFNLTQPRDYLILIRQVKSLPQNICQIIDNLINQIQNKENQISQQYQKLYLKFYQKMMIILDYIPWQTKYLKISKFLSALIDYLIHHNYYNQIRQIVENNIIRIFSSLKRDLFRYLIVTVVADYGKYFYQNSKIYEQIKNSLKLQSCANIISILLYHIIRHTEQPFQTISQQQIGPNNNQQFYNEQDFQYKQSNGSQPENIFMFFENCLNEGSQQLVLQTIEVIKVHINENQKDLKMWLHLIFQQCQKGSQQIKTSCIQFLEQLCYEKIIKWNKMSEEEKNLNSNFPQLNIRFTYLQLNSKQQVQRKLQKERENKNSKFLKIELEKWMTKNQSMMKSLSGYMDKQQRSYIKPKGNDNYLSYGLQYQKNLQFLPWNIQINQEYYFSFAEYKPFQNKIKLRSKPNFKISQFIDKITIVPINVGFNFNPNHRQEDQNNVSNNIVLTKEQIISSFQKQSKKKTWLRENTIIQIAKYGDDFILEKVVTSLQLEQNFIKPLPFECNFIFLISKSQLGVKFLKENKFFQTLEDIIKSEKYCQTMTKGAFYILGFLLSSKQFLKTIQKISFLQLILKRLNQVEQDQVTANLQIRQLMLWIINIFSKDDECLKRLKEKRQQWKTIKIQSSKIGSCWMCYPLKQVYIPIQNKPNENQKKKFDRFAMIKNFWDQKFKNDNKIADSKHQNKKQLKNQNSLIDEKDYFEDARRYLNDPRTDKIKSVQSPINVNLERKDIFYHFQNILTYISINNFNADRTYLVLYTFSHYIADKKFIEDFPNGFSLP